MEWWFDRFRIALQSIIFFILASLSPVRSAIEALFVVATFDFFAGLAGNVWTGKEHFRIGKAFGSMYKILAYLFLVIVAHFATNHLGEVEFATLLTKYITLLIIYWYFINILSNLRVAFPRSSGIAFLYLLASLKILPLLADKVGLGGADVQELADKARKVTERKRDERDKTDSSTLHSDERGQSDDH